MFGRSLDEQLQTRINSIFKSFESLEKLSQDVKNLNNNFKWPKGIKQESTKKYLDHESFSSDDIEVSIIIPSQNKYPLNLFTLYSLEYQTFNLSKMEVILIDDASKDETEEKLKDYHPPYHFKYIRSTERLGRARVRNVGIQSARGSVLIFLDAEMMTEPNFVENHYINHQTQNNLILSGALYLRAVYSCIFPTFSEQQMNKIADVTKQNQELYSRYKKCKFPPEHPYPLIDKRDIAQKSFKELSFNAYPWYQQIVRNFNEELEGFAFPWMAFLTGNMSIRRELIIQAALFDEEFYHYGYEDWELGYRLYLMGAQYKISNEIVAYHQEHPVEESKWREAVGNFGLFTIKHHDVDVLILGLELARMTDLLTMNHILNEYKLLLESNPTNFQSFSEKFICILETIVLLLEVDIRHFNLLGAAGFSSKAKSDLKNDMKQINKLKKYPNLTEFLDKVINAY
ncbi:glycosyltransferase [Neobacillus drentensis]|uniref:glycosyltransferase family 2 protein n=1 Tax=Neobacillus drentensis TaxID=220684 RepID=UPI003000F2D6